jgi:hypothetical protein
LLEDRLRWGEQLGSRCGGSTSCSSSSSVGFLLHARDTKFTAAFDEVSGRIEERLDQLSANFTD